MKSRAFTINNKRLVETNNINEILYDEIGLVKEKIDGKKYINVYGRDKEGYLVSLTPKYPEISTKNIIESTYNELLLKKNNNELIPGTYYRITDYITTVDVNNNYKSAEHPFDIIILALDTNLFSEQAYAIHSNRDIDGYFLNCRLESWKLWYSFNNDTNRFQWANIDSGKGVIYRMIDEFNNDLPYDFKNIQFRRTINSRNRYFYTFSLGDEALSSIKDASIVSDNNLCNCNMMNPYYINTEKDNVTYTTQVLNNIILCCFDTNNIEDGIVKLSNNTWENDCYNMIFLNRCYSNHFGYNNKNFTASNFYANVFGDNCYDNSFGNFCYYNSFGNDCSANIIGNYFNNNILGNGCSANVFGNTEDDNRNSNFIRYCTMYNAIKYVKVNVGKTAGGGLQNAQLLNGVKGTSKFNLLEIPFKVNTPYSQIACFNSDGEIKAYIPADLVS